MPSACARPRPVDLLLRGHHYRACRAALRAAGAIVPDETGARAPSRAATERWRPAMPAAASRTVSCPAPGEPPGRAPRAGAADKRPEEMPSCRSQGASRAARTAYGLWTPVVSAPANTASEGQRPEPGRPVHATIARAAILDAVEDSLPGLPGHPYGSGPGDAGGDRLRAGDLRPLTCLAAVGPGRCSSATSSCSTLPGGAARRVNMRHGGWLATPGRRWLGGEHE